MGAHQVLEAATHLPGRQVERGELAIGRRVADPLYAAQEQEILLRRPRGAPGGGPKRGEPAELAPALPVVEASRHGIGCDERTQAGAEDAPPPVLREHLGDDCARERARIGGPPGVDLEGRPFRGHPGLVGGEEEGAFVAEVLVEDRGREAGAAGEAVGVGAVVANLVELHGCRPHQAIPRLRSAASPAGMPAAEDQGGWSARTEHV